LRNSVSGSPCSSARSHSGCSGWFGRALGSCCSVAGILFRSLFLEPPWIFGGITFSF